MSCSSQKQVQENALVYYGKTACLGKCPVYDVYVFPDGKVHYQGFQNVTKKGKFEYTISLQKVKEIQQELEKLNFLSNGKIVRDVPKTIVKYNGKQLKLNNTKQLERLQKLLEKIIS